MRRASGAICLLASIAPALALPVLTQADAIARARVEFTKRLGSKAVIEPITARLSDNVWIASTGEAQQCRATLSFWRRLRGDSCLVHGWILTISATNGQVTSFGHGQ